MWLAAASKGIFGGANQLGLLFVSEPEVKGKIRFECTYPYFFPVAK